ncbi:MAG: hypothetical protein LPK08_05350 [Halomonas sp.]|nr:hypothetical protein [Halomonas sp.]
MSTMVATTLQRCRRLYRRIWRRVGPRQYPVPDLSRETVGPLEAFYAYRGLPCLIQCRLADCRWFGPTGIAYGRDSLHPYVQSLRQYLDGECRSYRGSCLETYWQHWQPSTLAASLGVSSDTAHPWLRRVPPLSDFMPWSDVRQLQLLRTLAELSPQGEGAESSLVSETAVRQVGPKPDWFGERRLNQLVALHRAILQEGYRYQASQRLEYFHQHIVLDTLARGDEVRFLVANGQHRASVLSVLGYASVPALVHVSHRRGPSLVRREDCFSWPSVRQGIFTANQALEIFDRVFEGRPPPGFPRLARAGEATLAPGELEIAPCAQVMPEGSPTERH